MPEALSRCPSCLEPTAGLDQCAKCGWVSGQEPESPLFLAPGTRLRERYLLGQVLGHGGFGITYLAWDETLTTKVAIKEYLPKELAMRRPTQTVSAYSGETAEAFRVGLQRFVEEARTLARFHNHPYVIPVIDYFEANNTAYLVMRYLEGMTLHEYLEEKGGRLSYPLAEQILTRVLDGLRPLHEAGMLHRDIAPDNIYLTSEQQIKLFDFGSARLTLGKHTRTLTAVVKAGYSPIEQYNSEGKQGPWTDIYATAATFYHALTGDKPPDALERLSPPEVSTGTAAPLMPPSALGVDIPAHVEQALLKALAVRAADRFQEVEAFQRAIRAGEVQPEEYVSGPSPARSPSPRWRFALVIVVLLGALLAAFKLFSPDPLRSTLDSREVERAEEAARAEQKRQADEAKRALEAARAEQARWKDEARRAEEARRAQEAAREEQIRQAEEAKRALEAARAEQARWAEEARRAEEAARAEQAQKARDTRLRVAAPKPAPLKKTVPCGPEFWTAQQLAARFSGHTWEGSTGKLNWKEYYAPNQSFYGSGLRNGERRGPWTGRWYLKNDAYCTCTGKCEEYACRKVWQTGTCPRPGETWTWDIAKNKKWSRVRAISVGDTYDLSR